MCENHQRKDSYLPFSCAIGGVFLLLFIFRNIPKILKCNIFISLVYATLLILGYLAFLRFIFKYSRLKPNYKLKYTILLLIWYGIFIFLMYTFFNTTINEFFKGPQENLWIYLPLFGFIALLYRISIFIEVQKGENNLTKKYKQIFNLLFKFIIGFSFVGFVLIFVFFESLFEKITLNHSFVSLDIAAVLAVLFTLADIAIHCAIMHRQQKDNTKHPAS